MWPEAALAVHRRRRPDAPGGARCLAEPPCQLLDLANREPAALDEREELGLPKRIKPQQRPAVPFADPPRAE